MTGALKLIKTAPHFTLTLLIQRRSQIPVLAGRGRSGLFLLLGMLNLTAPTLTGQPQRANLNAPRFARDDRGGILPIARANFRLARPGGRALPHARTADAAALVAIRPISLRRRRRAPGNNAQVCR